MTCCYVSQIRPRLHCLVMLLQLLLESRFASTVVGDTVINLSHWEYDLISDSPRHVNIFRKALVPSLSRPFNARAH